MHDVDRRGNVDGGRMRRMQWKEKGREDVETEHRDAHLKGPPLSGASPEERPERPYSTFTFSRDFLSLLLSLTLSPLASTFQS
jgi:hypothetical protein